MALVHLQKCDEAAVQLDDVQKFLRSKHSGDCTEEPWTCMRCAAEHSMRIAGAQLRALSEAGYAVVKNRKRNLTVWDSIMIGCGDWDR